MNKKAILQYLSSIADSGITDLPNATDAMQSKIAQSFEATQRLIDSKEGDEPLVETVSESEMPLPDSQKIMSAMPPTQNVGSKFSIGEKMAGLEVLQREVKGCNQCRELVDNRIQTVFGVGDPDAKLCFMGEAPGADEDRQGEPFIGAAGQLLNRIIVACKMKREEVYILNTIKCRPPNNRNPTETECGNCRPFLNRQLELLQPEYICCLGGIAAKHLLSTELSVGRLRGRLYDYEGIPVVVTYHPAYLLRNPDAKKDVWADMKFLMSEMGHDIS